MKTVVSLLSACLIVSSCTTETEPDAPSSAPEQQPPSPSQTQGQTQGQTQSPAQQQADAPPAAAPPQVRIRGTVQRLEGQFLTVLTESDGAVLVTLAPNVGINGLARRSLADISDNTFIGTTAVRGRDGRWNATEVHIFPEAMRGAGEGHYPWDLPESTMTNAAVTGTVTAGEGRTLKLKYATGDVEVDVSPDTPIVELVPGDASLLMPGATVFVLGAPESGESINAFAILAEKDGVKPPM